MKTSVSPVAGCRERDDFRGECIKHKIGSLFEQTIGPAIDKIRSVLVDQRRPVKPVLARPPRAVL